MATKVNRAGNQQPYVPAGNGDASGEYADSAYGNVHHKAPEDTHENKGENIVITQKPKTENKESKDNKEHSNISEYLNTHSVMSKEAKQRAEKDIALGKEESQKILYNALKKGNYTFSSGKSSYYRNADGNVSLSKADMESELREEGEVFWHENGHLIDYSDSKFEFGTPSSSQTYSVKYRSKEDGKTLFESVYEEGQKFAKDKNILEEIYKDKDEIYKKYELKLGFDQEEYDKITQKAQEFSELVEKDERVVKARQELNNVSFSDYENFSKKRDNFYNIVNEVRNEVENSDEFKSATSRQSELMTLKYRAKFEAQKEYVKKYSSLSDMLDAATKGRRNLEAGSHGSRYWKGSQYAQAHEFFAEAFSAYSRDAEEYKIMKKYFPRTTEIFEEIIGELKNG